MGNRFAEIAFTPSVQAFQESMGSRKSYARQESGPETNSGLGEPEQQFILMRDTFYLSSTSETGWPYVQHRGGPVGFLKVLDRSTIGFADFRGNRQYVSAGNISKDDRVALMLMDYPNRTRLKLLGHARLISSGEPELLASLRTPGYRAHVERGMLIKVAAFDWNCPQHITPRFTGSEIEGIVDSLKDRIAALETRLAKKLP